MNIKQTIFMNVLISLIYSIVMGFAMLAINEGFFPGFLSAWAGSIATGFVVALPLSFLIIPPIQRLASKLFKD